MSPRQTTHFLAAALLLPGFPLAASNELINLSSKTLRVCVEEVAVTEGTLLLNVYPPSQASGAFSALEAPVEETKAPEAVPSFTGIYDENRQFKKGTFIILVPPGGRMVFSTQFEDAATPLAGGMFHFVMGLQGVDQEETGIHLWYRVTSPSFALSGEALSHWTPDLMSGKRLPLEVEAPDGKDPRTRVLDGSKGGCECTIL